MSNLGIPFCNIGLLWIITRYFKIIKFGIMESKNWLGFLGINPRDKWYNSKFRQISFKVIIFILFYLEVNNVCSIKKASYFDQETIIEEETAQ